VSLCHQKRTAVDELERRLCQIWAEVLRLDTVGVEDNFFARGGNSLLAIHLTARMSDEFGVELPVRALFETPQVAGFADRLRDVLRPAVARPERDRGR
jgi:acyl carrier protein